jgi:hypothetical protein
VACACLWDSSRLPVIPGKFPLFYLVIASSNIFLQSFIGGPVAYKALPRPQFSQLQQKIVPIYFALQTALPLVLFFTHPHFSAAILLAPTSPVWRSTVLPLFLVLATSLANLAMVGPATTKIMRERKAQETKEGKKYYDEGPKSEEMAALNKRFGAVHGVSSMLNLVGLLATGWYGVVLGNKLKF